MQKHEWFDQEREKKYVENTRLAWICLILSMFVMFLVFLSAQLDSALPIVGVSIELIVILLAVFAKLQAIAIIQADRAVRLQKTVDVWGEVEHGKRTKKN